MPLIEAILPHAPAFVVVLARVGGLFIFTPLLSSASVPLRVRALLDPRQVPVPFEAGDGARADFAGSTDSASIAPRSWTSL